MIITIITVKTVNTVNTVKLAYLRVDFQTFFSLELLNDSDGDVGDGLSCNFGELTKE